MQLKFTHSWSSTPVHGLRAGLGSSARHYLNCWHECSSFLVMFHNVSCFIGLWTGQSRCPNFIPFTPVHGPTLTLSPWIFNSAYGKVKQLRRGYDGLGELVCFPRGMCIFFEASESSSIIPLTT